MKRLLVILVAVAVLAGCVDWKRYPVVSVFNDSAVSGSFVLGSGFISETEYYFVFCQLPDGGLQRKKLSARDTVIYEDVAEGEPYLEQEYWTCQNRLHVPKGTVIRHMQIDGWAEDR
jgi:hypothetical protein